MPADELAAPRVALRARIEALVRMAQEVAVTGQRDHPEIRGYSVLRLIGRGGTGAVYLARQDRVGGRMVALKVLPGASAISETARERFVREAQALGRLNHNNIVTIYDVVQACWRTRWNGSRAARWLM
jgi:serine/threonine protein kinase